MLLYAAKKIINNNYTFSKKGGQKKKRKYHSQFQRTRVFRKKREIHDTRDEKVILE